MIKTRTPQQGSGITAREWFWMGAGALGTLIVLVVVHRTLSELIEAPATPPREAPAHIDAPVPAPPPPQPPEPIVPVYTPSKTLPPVPKDESKLTAEMLRKHSRENPDAADALSDEEIQEIQRRGAVIM